VAGNIYAPSEVEGDIAARCYAKVHGLQTGVCCSAATFWSFWSTNKSRCDEHLLINLVEALRAAPLKF
jgi:hypothetical protein